MLSAVHSDRSGRVFVSADYGAAGFDGASDAPLADTIPLPDGARVVPIEREARGVDRSGRSRALGRTRWALAAVLPSGYTRTHHPAYRSREHDAPLAPLPYAALAGGAGGELRVAALRTAAARAVPTVDVEAIVAAGLRAWPANRLARQLARCARDYACSFARDAFAGRGRAGAPVGAATSEAPDAGVAARWTFDESPTEPAAFRPDAAEIADLVLAFLAGGGEGVSFGRACEGDPLAAAPLLEDAVRRIRAGTTAGRLHLETAGSSPAALRRMVAAGIGAVTVRIASARADTFEALHRPIRHRWSEVRATLRLVAELGASLEIALLVFPGITDRPSELDELVALFGELPAARVSLRDLAADPEHALRLVPSRERPVGIAAALDRLHREVPGALGAPA